MCKFKSNEKISIITTMTNPDDRNDPWKEALDATEILLMK